MLGDEGVGAVFRRKLLAAVEMHPERRHVGAETHHRLLVGRRCLAFEIRRAVGAAAVIGKTEVKAGAGRVVELVGGRIVAHAIGAVVGEIELAGRRVKIHAHRIAHAAGKHPGGAAAGVEAQDGTLQAAHAADVAGRADGDEYPTVRAEGDVAPAVGGLVGKAVEQNARLGAAGGSEIGDSEADHPVLFGHEQATVPPGDAVRHVEASDHRKDGVGEVVAIGIDNGVYQRAPGADEDDAEFLGHRHGAGARHPRVKLDGESGRQDDAGERRFVAGTTGRKRLQSQTEAEDRADEPGRSSGKELEAAAAHVNSDWRSRPGARRTGPRCPTGRRSRSPG